ncbi:YdcF family protein [Pleurocapsa sp. PCC 7319]|uniref:YdcF family protein n=1 Tax=Pleurocapsa sp. PCC 7319 TaxID=118161 RepID=UPI000344AF58|nr:YdcF family protein [Pleurocapsa sp. PCC 7319]
MKLSEIDVNELSKEQITKILFGNEQDNNKQGDCIFVYGGKGIERVHKAVDLYNQERAKYILFTGGLGYGKYTYPLSFKMRDSALELGVPEENILVEDRSNHVKEGAIGEA